MNDHWVMEFGADTLLEVAAAVAHLGRCPADIARLDDDHLLKAQSLVAMLRRHGDAYAAWIAGAVAQRSHREHGHDGLAQRTGFLSPEALIQSVTGSTRSDAVKLVKVGTMMADAESARSTDATPSDLSAESASPSWQHPIATAVSRGWVSVDAADAIRHGLGDGDEAVPAEKLLAAAEFLLREAQLLNADELLRRARRLRDELDVDGVMRRAKDQRDARSFKIWRQADGMYRVSALYDPEDGRLLESIIDRATSPRRGGPRFVDSVERARADAILHDERTTDQIAADTLIDLLRVGVDADPGAILGRGRPAVRVIVTAEAVRTRGGQGHLDGHPDPVPFTTVERHLCETGNIGVRFDDDGQCVNVGREQRLFTTRQRIGIAVRDGGCRWPCCDRPPSWCEAHHIDQWARDAGRTDIADGVLLCRRHHLLLHNNRWDISRTGGRYWLRPPVSIDPVQQLRGMPSKSPPMLRRFPTGAAAHPDRGLDSAHHRTGGAEDPDASCRADGRADTGCRAHDGTDAGRRAHDGTDAGRRSCGQ